jgi:hypothetical protein
VIMQHLATDIMSLSGVEPRPIGRPTRKYSLEDLSDPAYLYNV